MWLGVLVGITLIITSPVTNPTYVLLTGAYPFWMGFMKFALLATMGELLALRMSAGAWQRPVGMIPKILIWGLIGISVTFVFAFYSAGVEAALSRGLLPSGTGVTTWFLKAFYTSLIMNLTFGPVFMTLHRLSDTYIDLRAKGLRPQFAEVISSVNWPDFFGFVVGKTIPLWWIPVHTLTFLLPGEYRVLAAAYLSIALGVILVSARARRPVNPGRQVRPVDEKLEVE